MENKIKEFDEKFKCINAETLGCDSKGNIPHQVGEDDWEAEQCQYCFERLFKYKDFLKQALQQTREDTIKEITARLEICLVENEDKYIIGNIKDLIYKINNIK